ncbi:hypothetical protein EV207_101132 [Scopulibacillus darangshiensis]|uniref:Uncharacterized protein n=1 Tax=Scopulibacillus darangshiensis TaxID=442528 RepID=A0A4R2PCP9_9BACL|nr:hypothetical protein [Scopulibacillus darangshiensis]TCP32154.1 hypothetical protein EV207_101132 [Scopulibacillus darangshiensis]
MLTKGMTLTDPQEYEPREISTCDGCGFCIVEGDEMVDMGSVHLHDSFNCFKDYIYHDGIRKIAGQE